MLELRLPPPPAMDVRLRKGQAGWFEALIAHFKHSIESDFSDGKGARRMGSKKVPLLAEAGTELQEPPPGRGKRVSRHSC